jgi:hypothetical protein
VFVVGAFVPQLPRITAMQKGRRERKNHLFGNGIRFISLVLLGISSLLWNQRVYVRYSIFILLCQYRDRQSIGTSQEDPYSHRSE